MTFSSVNETIGRHRWSICALVFAATTINYLDRNVLGLLKQTLSAAGVFGADKADQELNYSTVVICFQFAYAAGLLVAGRIIDGVGTKKGYAYSLIGWSFAAIGHAFGHHTWSFGFWRAALGVTEAGNFPAANKTMAEWFPKKERAFATGLYNSGANVGSIVAPLVVPYIASKWGWEWAFILTGVVGLIWLAFWYAMYDTPAAKLASGKLSQAEYDFIHSDLDEQEAEKADVGAAKPRMFEGLFSFRGRAQRGTFLAYSILIAAMGYIIFISLGSLLALPGPVKFPFWHHLILWPHVLGFVALLYVGGATQARRWHDLGMPGEYAWLSSLLNLTVAGVMILTALGCRWRDLGWPDRYVILGIAMVGLVAQVVLGLKGCGEGPNASGSSEPTLFDWRQTWAFLVGKFLTDPIWWFFLFWLPSFLEGENARKVQAFLAVHADYTGAKADIPGVISWPLAVAVVYTISGFGSIFGGWLPKRFINGGMDANKARKLSMFIFALFPLTVLFASRLGTINTWLAVATIAIACAAHAAWSANIFTTVSDMFPKKAVASVTGIGGMAGAVGGILIARAAGLLLKHYTALGKVEIAYGILFVVCGSAYLIAWLLMHLLVPRFKKIVL